MTQHSTAGRLALLVALVGTLTLLTFAGGAVAQSTDTELTNTTVSVDNDTRALHVSAIETNGTLDVTVYGLDSDGQTQVATSTLNASTDPEIYEYTVDAETYSRYRVVVTGDGADTLEVSKVQLVSGGGGFIGGNAPEIPPWSKAAGALGIAFLSGIILTRLN